MGGPPFGSGNPKDTTPGLRWTLRVPGGSVGQHGEDGGKVQEARQAREGQEAGRGVLDLPKAVEERMSEGRAEREAVPVDAHAEWTAPDGRPDPVGVLEQQNTTRVPDLIPIRHGRMIVSPFTFYRGGAAIMAWDLVEHADDGAARAVLRGRAPLELRRVRGAGPPARLRSQRLRRDASRAVRVGRQAPGRELRRRGARQRASPQGAARGGACRHRRLPHDDRPRGDESVPRRLVRPRRRR